MTWQSRAIYLGKAEGGRRTAGKQRLRGGGYDGMKSTLLCTCYAALQCWSDVWTMWGIGSRLQLD